jgi:hypothetical protein
VAAEVAGIAVVIGVLALHEFSTLPGTLFGSAPAVARPIEFALEASLLFAVGALVVAVSWKAAKHQVRLDRMLKVCAWCHKVELDGVWVTASQYLERKDHVTTSTGLCPACYAEAR